ncbi:MAG: hypothetical protein SFY69_08490 [Planctomycetota bacterium]|nr:hypothetical protein [Planctomycetota bacterium]
MASKESTEMGSAVAPAAPAEAQPAADATTGEVSTLQGTARELAAAALTSVQTQVIQGRRDPEKTGWIELRLTDQKDNPIPGETWEITCPAGTVFRGTTDEKGVARVEGIDEGSCTVSFPRLDAEAWEPG